MVKEPTRLCPEGTWCISHTTAVALLVIAALSSYIAYVHHQRHSITPYQQESAQLQSQPEPQPTTQTAPPQQTAPAQLQSQPPTLVSPDGKWTHHDPLPSRITNVYNNTTLAPPHEINMLRPPWRRTPDTSTVGLMPINIKTRGETPDMQQVGILRSKTNDKVLALYGRPTYRGSSKWIYYTGTDKYHSIKLPVEKNKRDCTAEYGCEELYDDDEVTVKGYNEVFQTSIYQLDAPRYIPFVV